MDQIERRAAERVMERDRARVFGGSRGPNAWQIYLCGPMSGYPGLNFAEFHQAAASLRGRGYRVISPAEPPIAQQPQCDWYSAVRGAIGGLLTCNAVATVTPSGIRQSRGATLELQIASALEMPVLYWHAWILAADARTGKRSPV